MLATSSQAQKSSLLPDRKCPMERSQRRAINVGRDGVAPPM
jgi:hypothetical protein